MPIDLRRLAPGAASLVFVAVVLSGCGGATERRVAARTDAIVITEDELALWTPLLGEKRELRDRLRKTEDRRSELLRIIALVRLVPLDHGDLVPDAAFEVGRRDLEARQIRSAYVDAVLRPRVSIDDSEVRQIFDDHRQNFQKADAVRLLEIFRWAPEDLPDLRAERRAELSRLQTLVESREDFEKLALKYSDATSAYKGGRIGILYRDQVAGALEAALFSGGRGLTDVVGSESGLHLFFITDRIPPRSNEFDDVAEGIERTLRRRRLERLIAQDAERLVDRHRLVVVPASETADGQPRLRLGGEMLTAEQLGVPAGASDEATAKRLRRRGLAILYERELDRRGIAPEPPDPLDVAWMQYRLAWTSLVVSELATDAAEESKESSRADRVPKLERWSFDLLRIPAGEGMTAWNAAFRMCHESAPDTGLEQILNGLEQRYGLAGRIEEFRGVTSGEAAPLGPEIHTTIKKILAPGDRSVPLFLEDRNQIVVIHLRERSVDEAASAAAAERRERQRLRAAVAQRLEAEILRRHRFTITSG